MNVPLPKRDIVREKFSQFGALGYLLLLGGLALGGPYGVLSWGESKTTLEARQQQIAALVHDRDVLKNRVALLNPDHADADLSAELIRRNLNVARPDEYVVDLDSPR
ncbi:MAG: septum formation initiator [Croceibacterium sp.]